MESRLGFHGLCFLAAVISTFVMGSAWPMVATVVSSVALESALARLEN